MFNVYGHIKRLDNNEYNTELNALDQYKQLQHLRNIITNLGKREQLASKYRNRIQKFIFEVMLV